MQLTFLKEAWDVSLWMPGDSLEHLQAETEAGVDTEYEVMETHGSVMKPVLAQFAFPGAKVAYAVWWKYMAEFMKDLNAICPGLTYHFFNLGNDLEALDWRSNQLLDLTFNHDSRVTDLLIRCSLYELTQGTFFSSMGLAYYTAKYVGVQLSKDDDIRLTFKQDMELTPRHVLYACEDAVATLTLAQTVPAQVLESKKTRGGVALYFMGRRGYPGDRELCNELKAEQVKIMGQHVRYLDTWGVGPSKILGESTGLTGSTKEMNKILLVMEHQLGITFPRTPKDPDKVSLKEDDAILPFIRKGLKVHPLILEHKAYQHAQKMVSTYLNDEHLCEDGKWHPRYLPIKMNGRTGAVRPPAQTYPRKGRYRNIFTAGVNPETGKRRVILAIDVCQAELCALAQSNYQKFGFSVMRDLINNDIDLHYWFGTEVIAAKMLNLVIAQLTALQVQGYRKDSKPVNFGIPGGLGPTSFVIYARNTWGRTFTLEFAKEVKEYWLEAFPECRKHLKPTPDPVWTLTHLRNNIKAAGVPSNLVRTLNSMEQCIVCMTDQGFTDKQVSNILWESNRYQVQTIHGRIKRNSPYSAACNYAFSAPTADAMSEQLGECEKLQLPLVNFVHDENHFLLDVDENLQANVIRCNNAVKEPVQRMIPDVKIKTEVALMYAWDKRAKQIYEDGELVIWEPWMAEDDE